MKIIGITGQKESGKDTLGQHLELAFRSQGRFVVSTAFADPLYEICQELYGWAGFKSKEYYDTHKHEKEVPLKRVPKKLTPREILITVGEALKKHNPDLFVDVTLNWLGKYPKDTIGIITDVRYLQELQAIIYEHDSVIVRVQRDGLPKPEFPDNLLDDEDWKAVVSERAQVFEIPNNGDLRDLKFQAVKLSRSIW